jgi:hypothetical protein
MFVLVAATAVAIVSLLFASPVWQTIVGFLALLSAIVAVIVSLIDHGQRRAFAVGFSVAMLGYLLIVVAGQKLALTRTENSMLPPDQAYLPTSLLLQSFFDGTSRTTYYDAQTHQLIPASESQNLFMVSGGYGTGGFGGGGGGGFGGAAIQPPAGQRAACYDVYPSRENFMAEGHIWLALLFGYIGGHFACLVYRRRDREFKKQP